MDESIIRVRKPQILDIEKFISTAGSSLNTFRYFKNRDVSCVESHVVTFLYKQGDDFLGYGHLDKEGDDVWLGICVAESHLGRGYGKQIMIDLLDAGSEQGIKSIRLTVDVNNSIAVKLYQKLGFFIESTVNNTFYMRLLLK